MSALKDVKRHFSERSLDSLSHSIFMFYVITALTTARDDEGGIEVAILKIAIGKLNSLRRFRPFSSANPRRLRRHRRPGPKRKALLCAVKAQTWARLEGPMQDASPSKGRRLTISGLAAVGILKTQPLKRENEYTRGSLFQRQKSCIGLLSRAQVCSYTAHRRAFLLAPGRNAPHRGEGF